MRNTRWKSGIDRVGVVDVATHGAVGHITYMYSDQMSGGVCLPGFPPASRRMYMYRKIDRADVADAAVQTYVVYM